MIEEFTDDGYSGSALIARRLTACATRPRPACSTADASSADRLARVYAYQVLIIEESKRFGVSVRFLEGPAHGEDPQTTLLVQMQGVIAI